MDYKFIVVSAKGLQESRVSIEEPVQSWQPSPIHVCIKPFSTPHQTFIVFQR